MNIIELDNIWDDLSFSIEEHCNYPLSQKDFLDNLNLIAEDVAKSTFDEDDPSLEQAGKDLFGDDDSEINDFTNNYIDSSLSDYEDKIKEFLKQNSGEIIIRYNREQKQLEDTLKDVID